MIVSIIGLIVFASGKTIEAGDLQGAPETLGDFPPFSKEEIERLRQQIQDDSKKILEEKE